jgi:hypothetical protein
MGHMNEYVLNMVETMDGFWIQYYENDVRNDNVALFMC